jgi:hypothetical protein
MRDTPQTITEPPPEGTVGWMFLGVYMLGRRIQAREPPVQNIRQLEAALYREWQLLSQQDIRRLTGGMRCRVEAVIQARGGYTRY